MLAAYLGLGLACRMWRSRPTVVEGRDGDPRPPVPPPVQPPDQQPYRAFFHATRAGLDPEVIAAAEQPPRSMTGPSRGTAADARAIPDCHLRTGRRSKRRRPARRGDRRRLPRRGRRTPARLHPLPERRLRDRPRARSGRGIGPRGLPALPSLLPASRRLGGFGGAVLVDGARWRSSGKDAGKLAYWSSTWATEDAAARPARSIPAAQTLFLSSLLRGSSRGTLRPLVRAARRRSAPAVPPR